MRLPLSAANSNNMVCFIAIPTKCSALSLTPLHLNLVAAYHLIPIYPLASKFISFFFCTTFREPSRSLEPGQCHQPDIVVQTVHARLQRGGIMQHHQGFAGHRSASGRDAGVYAAA